MGYIQMAIKIIFNFPSVELLELQAHLMTLLPIRVLGRLMCCPYGYGLDQGGDLGSQWDQV